MKKQLIFFVMLVSLAGMFALQGCTEEPGPLYTHYSFTTPKLVSPADAATIDITGTTVNLTWASENKDNDPVDADVYFGEESDPPLFKADNTALSLSVTVEKGKTYYWRVVMKDKNGIPTDGPEWSFTVFEPIGVFVGTYHTVDEGGYEYDLDFAKKSANVLETDNYWDSGWHAEFTMDFVNKTFNMPMTTWSTYGGIESGTLNMVTGTMTTTYTIYHPVSPAPVAIESGAHVYTKISK